MQNTQNYSNDPKELRTSSLVAIILASVLLPPILLFSLCAITRFPPQIFGRDEDHFRAFVIDPVPDSVDIINVEFDDQMIFTDSVYWFMFTIDEKDLQQIISEHALQPAEGDCSEPYNSPDWQYFPTTPNMEKFEFRDEENSDILSLCYDPSSSIALYVYFHY